MMNPQVAHTSLAHNASYFEALIADYLMARNGQHFNRLATAKISITSIRYSWLELPLGFAKGSARY
jgi:hypothetical protein